MTEVLKTIWNGVLGRHPSYTIKEDLSGKVALVTGGSSGIGKATCYALARKGCRVFIAARNKEKTMPIIEDIIKETGAQVEFIEAQLDDLNSVKNCAKEFLSKDIPLHFLVNNAGLGMIPGRTKDGFQMSFGVNYLSHFLLTELLSQKLRDSAPARVINITSTGNTLGVRYNFDRVRDEDDGKIAQYNNSKLAQVMHTRKLAQLFNDSQVSSYCLHPGVVGTDIWKAFPKPVQVTMKKFMLTEEQGAMTTLYCIGEKDLPSGSYYNECQPGTYNKLADDQQLVDELYKKSLELVSQYLK